MARNTGVFIKDAEVMAQCETIHAFMVVTGDNFFGLFFQVQPLELPRKPESSSPLLESSPPKPI
jgi:hypothetical protein